MKRLLIGFLIGVVAIVSFGCVSQHVNSASYSRIDIIYEEGRASKGNHAYTVIKDEETGCIVLIVENTWLSTMGVTTLKCE